MKVRFAKYIALALAGAAIFGSSSASAATSCPGTAGWGTGRVTSVVQDSAALASIAGGSYVGIEISYDLSPSKQYFFTAGFATLQSSDHRARTLLQLATAAFASQTPVLASVIAGNCNDTVTLEGKTWIKGWQGLATGNYAKP